MFIFAVCQVGAEPTLKAEIAHAYPDLRFAFSRPGFLTFKSASDEPGHSIDPKIEIQTIFARAYGISVGKISEGDSDRLVERVLEAARGLVKPSSKLRLHLWERDRYAPSEEPKDFVAGALASIAKKKLLGAAPAGLFEESSVAENGDRVFDVVVIEENEWWVGYHTHNRHHSPYPGGRPEITLPPEAPSRAYLKLEEALIWSGARVRSGDTAVEIGSAPGGASYALLKRGVNVVGIDPAEMDPIVFRFRKDPFFEHVAKTVSMVPRESLPEQIDWLLLDMNVAPSVSLFAVDRLASRMSSTLLGVILTIKLNQWRVAREIPSMIEHLKAMGMVRIRATQLPSNRQEICVVGFTRKGLARKTLTNA